MSGCLKNACNRLKSHEKGSGVLGSGLGVWFKGMALESVRMIITISIFLSTITLVSGYNTGYEYGMNKEKAINAITYLEKEYPGVFDGLEQIRFSNSKCVNNWGGTCNVASYEFKGNHNRIIIGRYSSNDDYDTLALLIHETIHHRQVMDKRVVDAYNGFPYWAEEEANSMIINNWS